MNRRGFIKLTGAALVGAFVVPRIELPASLAAAPPRGAFIPVYWDNLLRKELLRLGHPRQLPPPFRGPVEMPRYFGGTFRQAKAYKFKGEFRCAELEGRFDKIHGAYALSPELISLSKDPRSIYELAIHDIARDIALKAHHENLYLFVPEARVIIKTAGLYSHGAFCEHGGHATVACKVYGMNLNQLTLRRGR